MVSTKQYRENIEYWREKNRLAAKAYRINHPEKYEEHKASQNEMKRRYRKTVREHGIRGYMLCAFITGKTSEERGKESCDDEVNNGWPTD